MANSFQGVQSALAILKNYYAGPVVTQFNDDLPILRASEKGTEKWSGLQVIRSVKVRRNQGVGAVSDGGVLPSIGNQTTQQAIIAAKYNYLRFGLTAPLIKSSQNDKGSFVRAMEYEMQEGLNDSKSDISRQLSWDGTGYIAQIAANVAASNTITVVGREGTNENGDKFVDQTMVVDIVTTGGAVQASSVTINSVTSGATATLVLSAPVTCNAGDKLIRSGTTGNEIQGILQPLDGNTTTIFNINRATFPQFQGNSINAGGNQLSLDRMQQAYNEARRRGGGKPNAVFCDFDSERFYNRLLVADRRYQPGVKGDGTFTKVDGSYLEFSGSPVAPDKDCPNRMFFLDSSTWKKYVLSEMEWADETGSYMIAQNGSDSFEIRLRYFANLFCEKPAANSVLRNYISP